MKDGRTYLRIHCSLVLLIEARRKAIWTQRLERRHLLESKRNLLHCKFSQQLGIHVGRFPTVQGCNTIVHVQICPSLEQLVEISYKSTFNFLL
jgi:hypothetical protein